MTLRRLALAFALVAGMLGMHALAQGAPTTPHPAMVAIAGEHGADHGDEPSGHGHRDHDVGVCVAVVVAGGLVLTRPGVRCARRPSPVARLAGSADPSAWRAAAIVVPPPDLAVLGVMRC